jgi:hypothetical protein
MAAQKFHAANNFPFPELSSSLTRVMKQANRNISGLSFRKTNLERINITGY